MFEQILRRKELPAPAPDVSLTIRTAGPGDGDALVRLATLDSAAVPPAPVLLAEVGGEPWAAVSVADLSAVADPFHPTSELVWVLTERARRMRHRSRGGVRAWPPVPAALTG